MAVDRRTLRMIDSQKRILSGVTDTQARALLVAWARAWDEISVALDAAITDMILQAQDGTPQISRALTVRQASRSLRIASRHLERLILASGVRASEDLWRIIRLGAGDAADLTAGQLPAQLRASLVRVDDRQLTAIVERTTQRITAQHVWLAADADDAMRRELVRTIAVGDNPKVAARRMMARAEGVFNGGRNRALTIARTEQLDAYRAASKRQNLATPEVLQGWRWIADLSSRTCRSCIGMHGTDHPIAEDGPIDHHQGRCTRVPITKSWADLGFPELDEPKDLTPDAQKWFQGLPEDEQRRMLTNRGYDQWQAGNYPLSDWSSRRKTEGWRDSRAPSIPPRSPADGS